MIVQEPRFLIIDLHKNKAVPATTDEMQALRRRVEPLTGGAHFLRMEDSRDAKTTPAERTLPEV